ncbi:MAG: Ig-like domain repeat protein, partial [Terracidiphilus sp.]
AGQYSGAGIATPGGNITYNLGNGVIYTAAITSGGATLTVPATMAAGVYTATVSYAGDSNYVAASAVNFTLTVGSATLTVSANNATKAYGAPNPTFTGSVTGAAASDTFSETYTTGATPSSPVGTYSITPSVTGANLADYTVVTNNGTLTVTQASTTLAILGAALSGPASASFSFGSGGSIPIVVAGQYSGAGIASPSGNIAYSIGSGAVQTAAIVSSGAALLVPASQPAGTYTVAITYAGDTNYSGASISLTLTVTSATLTISANNATKVYGEANPTLSGNETGASFPETFTTAAVTLSPVGAYAIVPAVTGANVADYAQTVVNGTLTVTQATTTTALSTGGTVYSGQSVPLTAVVSPEYSGTPTGTVSFYDGTTLLGTATVNGGTANLSTTLASGVAQTLSATYNGDTNFTPSTSSPLSVAIAPLDFTIAVSGASIDTVLPGASASYTLTVTPTLGTYPGPVTFSVSGLPATDTVTFTPSTIAANGGTQTVTMTVQTAAATARENQSPGGPFGRLPIALGLLLLPFAGARRLRRQGRKFGRFLCLLLVLAGSIAAASMLTACSNSNGFFLTAPSSSPLSVTGLSGGVQHSVNVTLNVE